MKQKLLKSLLAIAVLCAGSGSVWADEHILYSQNFESFAADANFNTVPGYWQYTGANVQKIAESGGNKYLTYQTTNGSTRNAAINFNISSFIANDNWTVSFDASLAPGNTDAGMFLGIVGANGSATASNAWTASSGNLFSVKNAAKSSTSYEVTVGGYTLDDALTLTSGSYYHYILNWDGSKINLTITKDGEVTPALSTSKDYSSENNTTFGAPKAIFWVTTRYYGTTNIDNVIVSEEITEEVVSSPSISSAYAGANRTVTITGGTSTSGNDVTTYYTLDGTDPTSLSFVYSEPLDISSDCTVKAISISSTGKSSDIASLAVTVGKLTLATPTISASGFTNEDGVYVMNPTFNFACNNSGVEGAPVATLSYTFTPDGGAESEPVIASSFTPSTKGTLKVIASASNYNSSEKTLVVSNGYSVSYYGRDYTAATHEDPISTWGDAYSVAWAGWASGLTAYTATTVFTDDYHLNISNGNTVSLVEGWGWVRGDQKTYGYRVRYATEGDFIALKENTSKGADASATTYQTLYCDYGTGLITNYVTINVPASYAVQQLYHYSPAVVTEADLAILDCKRYETSSAFATAVAGESFASAAEVYAFHTAWQIAQAKASSLNDITKVIRNAAIDASGTDWANARIESGQKYTKAPDEYYLDQWQSTLDSYQTIYGLPAGSYKIKAATRGSAGASGNIYVYASGQADTNTAIHTDGNTGGTLDNGWSWTEVEFTLTATSDVKIGFWADASASGQWAGCDDWHLEITGVTGTIPSSGLGSLASAYGLDFSNASVSEGTLTAYVVNEITVDKAKVISVGEMPANSGVILEGTPGATYSIPVKADAAFAGTNYLQAAVTATDVAANQAYILQSGEFHLVTAASTVPAGKAYLLAVNVPSDAKALSFDFGDADAISDVRSKMEDGRSEIFNLAGQRMSKLQRGVNIVNGKKVMVK